MFPTDEIYTRLRHQMVVQQIQKRGIQDRHVLSAMNEVPRHVFVPESQRSSAYDDCPLPIGFQQTISQPYIVAYMTKNLALSGTDQVLEIGTGSGYQTAILSRLCKSVYTIEIIPRLAQRAKHIMASLGYENIHFLIADGSLGWPAQIQFDAILVTAGAPLAPAPLLQQIKSGGRMIIPVGDRFQQMLQVWQNIDGKAIKKDLLSVVFVPLKGKQGWRL
jgi:protein-L-isoaspartate(D-aspartate) O-methyltransferase